MENKKLYENCILCPRNCNTNRNDGNIGACMVSGKLKLAEFNNFSAENNPEGILRKDSTVHCTVCNKDFNFSQSKVIRDNDKKQSPKRLLVP